MKYNTNTIQAPYGDTLRKEQSLERRVKAELEDSIFVYVFVFVFVFVFIFIFVIVFLYIRCTEKEVWQTVRAGRLAAVGRKYLRNQLSMCFLSFVDGMLSPILKS